VKSKRHTRSYPLFIILIKQRLAKKKRTKNVSLISPKLIKCKCFFYCEKKKGLCILIDNDRLTDDDTRKNYEEFGHPDGKQSFTMGVALPKGLVEGNGMLLLAFYALAFGLGLPYFIVSSYLMVCLQYTNCYIGSMVV
jgi:hypothetical protein